jgi:CubicO group peptidase (beta-lactamase class C family)
MAMQVLDVVTPKGAEVFIREELLGKMGIKDYYWQIDTSGLPKAAAGSRFRSRDMIKMGQLVMDEGQWKGKTLIPREFMQVATSALDQNKHRGYGYFWWRHEVKHGGETHICHTGRGAGGQFIIMYPKLKLMAVTTAHNKGMGQMLKNAPKLLLEAFD